jgi:hypothetical protein
MKSNSIFTRLAAVCLAILIATVSITATGCSSKKGFKGTKKNSKVHGRKGLAPGMGN